MTGSNPDYVVPGFPIQQDPNHKFVDEKAHCWLLTARNLAIVVGHIHISLSVISLFEGLICHKTSTQGFGRQGLIDVGTAEDHTVILIVLFVLVL